MTPKFLISILGLNKLDSTKACLESVLANSGDPSRYILMLTNNGSQDDTWFYFESMHRRNPIGVIVINNKTNEGFIKPNNKAFETAITLECEYMICLNNDTIVPPGWLDYLAAPLDLDPNGALSGPGCYSLKDDMHGTDGPQKEYIEGSCLCSKVRLVSKYGPLFSDYLTFIYGDDSDLSLRMREAGHAIYQVPFILQHLRCTTVKQNEEVKALCDAAQEKNHTVLKKRWNHYLKCRTMAFPIVLKRRIACGDTLLLTPVIRALKQSNPLSPIFVETHSPDVLKNNPHIASCQPLFNIVNQAALVIDLEMAYEDRTDVHIIDAYADAVREMVGGLGDVDREIEIFPSHEEMYWAINLRAVNNWNSRIAVMHVDHGGWPGKNWPVERFADVARYLISKGWFVVAIGSKPLPSGFPAYDLTGRTTTLQLAALLKTSQLFIGGDSFPMHAAVASGCPTIGIFGVTHSNYIMARGRARTICLDADPAVPGAGQRHREAGSRCVVTTDECIRSIEVVDVCGAIEELS